MPFIAAADFFDSFQIYEYLLQYDQPIKLRQVIPGSRNLSILRTNQQIYREAIPVLYDLNTIIVTRNDFCKCTDANLKTPLRLDYARHLLVANFSQSIACTLNGPEGQCDVCRPSAMGLINAFREMPRLRTVLIDYHKYLAEMRLFRVRLQRETEMELEPISKSPGSFAYRLKGPGVGHLDIQFKCGRLS
jgi:hypothetical protein